MRKEKREALLDEIDLDKEQENIVLGSWYELILVLLKETKT